MQNSREDNTKSKQGRHVTAAPLFDQLISGDAPTSCRACWESERNTVATRALIISIRAEALRATRLSIIILV